MRVLYKVFESFQDTVYVEKLKRTDLITSFVCTCKKYFKIKHPELA